MRGRMSRRARGGTGPHTLRQGLRRLGASTKRATPRGGTSLGLKSVRGLRHARAGLQALPGRGLSCTRRHRRQPVPFGLRGIAGPWLRRRDAQPEQVEAASPERMLRRLRSQRRRRRLQRLSDARVARRFPASGCLRHLHICRRSGRAVFGPQHGCSSSRCCMCLILHCTARPSACIAIGSSGQSTLRPPLPPLTLGLDHRRPCQLARRRFTRLVPMRSQLP